MSTKTEEQLLAQELFDNAIDHLMDLSLSDEVITRIGKNIAYNMLAEIAKRCPVDSIPFFTRVRDEIDGVTY